MSAQFTYGFWNKTDGSQEAEKEGNYKSAKKLAKKPYTLSLPILTANIFNKLSIKKKLQSAKGITAQIHFF